LRNYEEFYAYGLSASKGKEAIEGQRKFDEKLARIDHEFKTRRERSRATVEAIIAEAIAPIEDIELRSY